MYYEFDRLYVVSDLHLGGTKGFQIFDQGAVFASFAKHLAKKGGGQVGLVLNGDIVDFLAETAGDAEKHYLDAKGAVQKLERIFTDPAFSPVWDALETFLKSPNRMLILVLGNHDVELALPRVRERLVEKLCGEDEAAKGRLLFAVDGSGFCCRVGGRRVLCIHGNEVDPWNVVDYHALLQTARALNRGAEVPEWEPNAGTKLVIDIMNSIKKRHPFVDLLKPETQAVPAVLLAVDPSQVRRVTQFGPVAYRLARDSIRSSIGFLSVEDEPGKETETSEAAMHALLGKSYGWSGAAELPEIDTLLDKTEERIDTGREAADLVDEMNGETLGILDIITDRVLGRKPEENLRTTLQEWLGSDASFDVDFKDETFKKLDKAVGDEIDFLVAGHTHLHRAIRRTNGSAYFNSGTWIRLIELSRDVLADAEHFKQMYDALSSGSMDKLDEQPGLVLRRPTVVTISATADGSAVGELQLVSKNARGAELQPVPETRLEV